MKRPQHKAAFEKITSIRGLDILQTARLFAIGNLVGANALIACLEAKYHHLSWPQRSTESMIHC